MKGDGGVDKEEDEVEAKKGRRWGVVGGEVQEEVKEAGMQKEENEEEGRWRRRGRGGEVTVRGYYRNSVAARGSG